MLGLNCSKRREPNAKSRTQEQARRLPPVGKTQCCARGQRSTSCDRGRAERPSQVAQKSANPVQETKEAPTGEVALIPVWKLSQKDEKESSGKCRVCRALRQQVAEDRLTQETVGHITSTRCAGQSEAATAEDNRCVTEIMKILGSGENGARGKMILTEHGEQAMSKMWASRNLRSYFPGSRYIAWPGKHTE